MKLSILLKSLLILTLFLIVIMVGNLIFEKVYPYPNKIQFGLTFTPKYATYLGLDWQKTYLRILDDLKVKYLRLPSYWDILEKEQNKFDFSQTDFLLNEAAKRNTRIILVLGARQPRWAECHIPQWARKLPVVERQKAILDFIQQVVQKYQNNPFIRAWQVENEPLLGSFGEGCDSPDTRFLSSEVNLVKELDKRPVILTDSGELGNWEELIKLSDIFGISIYRTVYNPYLGYQKYPFVPVFYKAKDVVFKGILGKSGQKTIIAELQTEPWLSDQDTHSSPQRQHQLFSEENFESNVNYAKKTGFEEIYLWGVEWWYWMAQKGHPEYLDYAKTLFR